MRNIWELLAMLAGPVQPLPCRAAGLVDCSLCGAEAVVPVDCADEGDGWWIALRCGNCGTRWNVTLNDDEASALDRALDRGVHQIARTVAALEQQRMQAVVDALSVALERDLIDADDFAPRSPAS